MCKDVAPYGLRLVARFAFASLTAALLAGCADASRFTGDPLGNPFRSASTDMSPTGSIDRPPAYGNDMAPPPYQPSSAIVSRPLAAPSDAPRHVASYETPAHTSPSYSDSYVAPKPVAPKPVAPKPEHTASYAAPSGHGSWSASGGMAIIVANGETAAILGSRYNVPTDALLHANGFSSSGDLRPGTRLVIPVYNANGGSRVAEVAPRQVPVRPPHDHSARERLARQIADREAVRRAKIAAEHDAAAQAAADRDLAVREAATRDALKHKAAKREIETEHETMHWKRGPQPARTSEIDTRGQRKAEADAQLTDTRAARKAARAERQAKIAEAKADAATAAKPARIAKVETVPERPTKVARLEETAPARKAQADPTPTASLPPAEEKVSANGAPEFRWPAHGRIIQGFKTGGNDGINIAVPEGTSVKAAESGVVAYAGSEIKGFGNLVLIRHPNGFVSAYANNGGLSVHRGEQVKRGQTIATSGQSGNVASPQLHFELRKGSTPVDPTRYLAGL